MRPVDDRGDEVLRRRAVLGGADPLQCLVELLVDERLHQFTAGREVGVEGHSRGARRSRDVVDRGGGAPLSS